LQDRWSNLSEYGLREIFDQLEKYTAEILQPDPSSRFSAEENRLLALQCVNRLNLRIGHLVRAGRKSSEEMRLLQRYVNNLTVALKTDNKPFMRSSLSSAKNLIRSIVEGS
jgi:DNA-directed RNA polymerase specialized sigma54-like protein